MPQTPLRLSLSHYRGPLGGDVWSIGPFVFRVCLEFRDSCFGFPHEAVSLADEALRRDCPGSSVVPCFRGRCRKHVPSTLVGPPGSCAARIALGACFRQQRPEAWRHFRRLWDLATGRRLKAARACLPQAGSPQSKITARMDAGRPRQDRPPRFTAQKKL